MFFFLVNINEKKKIKEVWVFKKFCNLQKNFPYQICLRIDSWSDLFWHSMLLFFTNYHSSSHYSYWFLSFFSSLFFRFISKTYWPKRATLMQMKMLKSLFMISVRRRRPNWPGIISWLYYCTNFPRPSRVLHF